MNLSNLYKKRFLENEIEQKNKIWQVLCHNFFNKYIDREASVLDVGAGYCEFINNISCKRKIALDLNPDVKKYANEDVEIVNESCFDIKSIKDNSIDRVFMSNFLEHMKNKQEIVDVITEAKRILKKEGKILILQPNIKYCGPKYWDFFDHHTPLTDTSLAEVLESSGFVVEKLISRFLPYSTKSKIPKNPIFVKIYLMFPMVWKIMGEQTFVVAKKEELI